MVLVILSVYHSGSTTLGFLERRLNFASAIDLQSPECFFLGVADFIWSA